MQRRLTDIIHLVSMVGPGMVPKDRKALQLRRGREDIEALAAIFGADVDALNIEPVTAAQLLRGFTMAGAHPAFTPEPVLTPAQIVAVFLNGVRGL
jgi:hypothetical protein